jgi:hypothetical protein
MAKTQNSKSGSTRVATQKFLAIADKTGLTVETKTGWLLMYAPGQRSARLLVHTGKRGTNCAELVSFETEFATAHPCPPAKTMTQLIDFNLDEKLILRNFYKTAKFLAERGANLAKLTETLVVPEVVASSSETPVAQAEPESENIAAVG